MPSAYNALAGLRPTVGLVSRTGMVPLNSVRDTAGPIARTVTDMAILLDVISGPDPEDDTTLRATGHRPQTYTAGLRRDALKGVRLGVLRQVFRRSVTDPRIMTHFETTIAELKAAGAEVVDPFAVPEIEPLQRGPSPARFKDDLTKWIARHSGVPFPSVKAIADSRLLHPLHQAFFEAAAAAKPIEEDLDTIEALKNELRYRDGFTAAMDAGQIDAVVFPTAAQLPPINGDRNTQLVTEPSLRRTRDRPRSVAASRSLRVPCNGLLCQSPAVIWAKAYPKGCKSWVVPGTRRRSLGMPMRMSKRRITAARRRQSRP